MMKRIRISIASSVSLLFLSAGAAHAQGTPSAPPPEAAPPPAAPAAAPGTVRLHFHTFRDRGNARIYSRQSDGRYGFVCATPCTADIPANTAMRVTYNDHEDDPHDFDSSARVGEELAVEVKGPSAAPVIGGAIMMGVGGVSIISGVVVVALADDTKSSGILYTKDELKTIGYVTIGIGAAIAIAGVIWFATKSSEPRIDAYTYRGEERYDERGRRRRSRADVFLDDQANAKPHDPLAPVAPASTPLGWSFAF